ncbi:hypothetical protein [Micromonospora carbonacea]|uniref:hypothetical protein n=1 Tax=Micromonospora carbonacea TaxID=47853 RepID=UPI00114CCF61|nr:hypothetical protein [Micromonospora carbonacea]
MRIVTSIDFDESPELVDSAGKPIKRPAGKSLKGVAFRASYWGNADGSQVYLGPARIAVSCEVDYKTAKGILRTLCAYKLLTLVQRGGGVTTPEREGNGGEYRLTVPHDLDKIAKVRSKEEIDAEIEAVKEKNRNKSTGQRRPRESRGTNTPVSLGDATGDTGQPVPATEESRGNGGVSHGATSSAIPTQHQPGKEENQPSSLSARTSVPPPCDPADDRERDESTKSEDPNLTWHQRLVVEAGCPVDRAPDVSAWLQAKFPDKGPGWWRKVQSTGDLTVHIQDALDALDADEPAPDDDTALHCATCRDTGKVTIRLVHESDAEKTTDCPDCTNDGRGKCRTHPGLPSRRCGGCRSDRLARGNEQPRTSQRTKEPLRPGYTQRPDGTRILTNSHDPNIDWNARV